MNSYPTEFERPSAPIEGRFAWTANDLERDDSWRISLDASHIEGLEQALAFADERGITTFHEDAAKVPLPGWETLIPHIRDSLEDGRGMVLLRGLPIERYTDEQAYLIYWLISSHLGTPIVQNARGELIGEVRDRGFDYQANNVRGYNTKAELRPHCDPSDCVGLLCVHPAKSGGESKVVSAVSIFNRIFEHEPELVEPLLNGFHFDLRGEGVTSDPNEVTFHRVPIFSYYAGYLSCRFNVRTAVDGMRKGGVEMTELEQRAIARLNELATDPEFIFPMTFERGDIQLLSNHSILHARDEFEDFDEPERKRRLLRVWLNFLDGRPLADRFADRFNTGPRNGIQVQEGAGYWVRAKVQS